MTGSIDCRQAGVAAYREIDAAILLPTLNEEEGVARTLDDIPFSEVRRRGWKVGPFIIDGGSSDRTRQVALSRGVPVVDQRSQGKGAAVREGLELLRGLGVRFAVVLDADATYPGSAVLPALELLDSGSDLVVGVRHRESGGPRSLRDLVHRTGNVLLNFAAGQYSRSTYLDLTSGFWAIDVQRAPELSLQTDDFGIEAELFLKAHRNGWNTSQIPIEYRKRTGSAKLRAVPDGTRILLTILRFGRRTLQAAPPTISKTPGILRELLLTAFINGYRDVELLCPPDLQVEAYAISHRLRRGGISPRIVVREDGPGPGDPVNPSSTLSSVPNLDAIEGGISMRFDAHGRLLRVELVDVRPPVSTSGGPAGYSDVSRSGAFMSREPRSRADLLDPLRLVGHQLNFDPEARRRSLLAANGIVHSRPTKTDAALVPDGGAAP